MSAADAAGGQGRSSSDTHHQTSRAKAERRQTTKPSAKGKSGLSDDLITAIKNDASGSALAAYLLFGSEAVGVPQDEWKAKGWAPAATNWAPSSLDYSRPEEGLSLPALAGLAAFRLNSARVAGGQPIELMSIPRLIGVIKGLRQRMAQEEIVAVIDAIGWRWNEVRSALPSWMSTAPLIDETLLANRHVLEAAKSVIAGRVATLAPTTKFNPLVAANPKQFDDWAAGLQERLKKTTIKAA